MNSADAQAEMCALPPEDVFMSALENIEQPGRLYLGRELDGGKTGKIGRAHV